MTKINTEYNRMYNNIKMNEFSVKYSKTPQNRFEFAYYHAYNHSGNTLCDIGMGGGEILYSLKEKYKIFYGIELSEERIKIAETRCKDMNIVFFNLAFDQLLDINIKGKVDTVTCLDVLDHMVDVRQALKNMFDILRKNGQLILTVPNIARISRRMQLLAGKFPSTSMPNEGLKRLGDSNLFDGGKLHYFTFKSLTELVYEAGFSGIEEYGVGKYQRIYNIYPKLLSGSISLVCTK